MDNDELLAAAMDMITTCRDKINQLDGREAGHYSTASGQLTEIDSQLSDLGQTLQEHAAALAQLAGTGSAGGGAARYRPEPAPVWWELAADGRWAPLARLSRWVDQVYRPGYGHLAAGLGPCWAAHDLCLYGLDILSELWSALYQQPHRSLALLSAQADYQTRILPALAAQLKAETTGCGHLRNVVPIPGQRRSTP